MRRFDADSDSELGEESDDDEIRRLDLIRQFVEAGGVLDGAALEEEESRLEEEEERATPDL